MSNTIQIKRSSTPSAVPTAGQLQQGELAVNLADKKLYTKDQTNTVVQLGFGEEALAARTGSASSVNFRNRIINGDMRIDQRNNGAAVTADGAFPVDRFQVAINSGSQSVQRSTTVPTGFVNSLAWTVTTGGSPSSSAQNAIRQAIEGFNVADLGWGAAGATSVTLSFWVRSSVTGTFSGSLLNGGYNRSYVFTFTISSANTWEYKTVTIAGDTSGTWLTTNGAGFRLSFDTGSGSNFNGTAGAWNAGEFYRASGANSIVATTGATFYITGVQLEAGSVATPFERRPYGTELMLCQRYAYILNGAFNGNRAFAQYALGGTFSTTQATLLIQHPVPMRDNASFSAINIGSIAVNGIATTNIVIDVGSRTSVSFIVTVGSGLTANQPARLFDSGTGNSALLVTAEL